MSSIERVEHPPKRYCVGCKHWYFDRGWAGTDETGGTEWSSGCALNRWQVSGQSGREGDYERALETAETCTEFSEREPSKPPRGDQTEVVARVQFGYLAKYEGDRGPRPEGTGEDVRDRLEALQADLSDPACVEIVVFGDDFPTQHWRK